MRPALIVTFFGFTAGTLVAVHSPPAYACSCDTPNLVSVAPAENETGVPIDVRFVTSEFAGVDEEGETTLMRVDDGTEVALTQTRIVERQSFGVMVVHRPTAMLEPLTEYAFSSESSYGGVATTFTTGEGMAPTPDPPEEIDRNANYERQRNRVFGAVIDSCGGGEVAYDSRTLAGDDPVRLASLDPDGLDAAALEGEVQVISRNDWVPIGRTACSNNWTEAGPGATSPLYVASMSRWGHLSDWRQLDDVSIPGRGGCSVDPSGNFGGGSWVAMLVVVALAGQRRRRRR